MFLAVFAPLMASAQLAIGVEKAVTAPDLETLARTSRIAIASSGVTMLAVWVDRRTDRGSEIVAARLDSAARVLDPRGIAITATPGVDEDLPFVEFDGIASFVVVWASGGNTMAARVNASGVITSGPLFVAEGRPEGLALNNRDMAIAIADASGTNISLLRSDLTLRPVTRLGRVQDVEVTALGHGFAVVWLEDEFSTGLQVVRAMRIDSRRVPVDTVTVTQLGKFERPASFAVGTHDDDAIIAAGAKDHMGIVRMTDDGTITAISATNAETPRTIEDVVPRGASGFDVLAVIDADARVFRYTGNSQTGEFEAVTGVPAEGAGAFVERVFTIWQVDGAVMGRFAFVDQQEPAFAVSRSPASQQLPALATDGTAALIAWSEDATDTSERLMARLVALDGTPDAAARVLTLGTRTMTTPSGPAVAFTSNNYFIAWIDQRNGSGRPAHLMMRNVSRSGTLGGTQQLSASANPATPAMASGPANALVVWIEALAGARELRGAFVSQPQASFPISDVAGEPALAAGENGYVVAGTTTYAAVRGTFVANDRTTRPLFESLPPFGSADSEPDVAWNGSNYLVVFKRNDHIYARLLNGDGSPRGSNLALVTSGINDNPRVAWDGHAFVVAWTARAAADPLSDGDLQVMRVLATGTAQAPVALSATARNDDHASLLAVGGGTVLIAYQRMAGELSNVHRAFTRVFVGPSIPVTPSKRRSVR